MWSLKREAVLFWIVTPRRAPCSLSFTGWTGVSTLPFHLSFHYILPVSSVNLPLRQSLHPFVVRFYHIIERYLIIYFLNGVIYPWMSSVPFVDWVESLQSISLYPHSSTCLHHHFSTSLILFYLYDSLWFSSHYFTKLLFLSPLFLIFPLYLYLS